MADLKVILDGILADKTLQPHDGKTFCNIAVRRALMNVGYTGIAPYSLANEMVGIMLGNGDFDKIDGETAHAIAMEGRLVIAGLQFAQCEEAATGRCDVSDKAKCPYCTATRPPTCQVKCGVYGKEVQMRRLAHGHVACVYPAPTEYSGSWLKYVPMVANVGKTNGIMRASKAFPVEPDYFTLKDVRNGIIH